MELSPQGLDPRIANNPWRVLGGPVPVGTLGTLAKVVKGKKIGVGDVVETGTEATAVLALVGLLNPAFLFAAPVLLAIRALRVVTQKTTD